MVGKEFGPVSGSPIEPRGVVLHENYFRAPFGKEPLAAFRKNVADANAMLDAPRDFEVNRSPNLTLAVQSCSETPLQMEGYIEEAKRQADAYPGNVHLLFVSARNSRATTAHAETHGFETVNVELGPGFRADMQNRGLEAASYNNVVFGIGHTLFAYSRSLELAGFEISDPDVMAAYGTVLPSNVASYWERKGAALLGADKLLAGGRKSAAAKSMGLLASDCSVVRRDLIQSVTDGKNYPVEYGRGGQDGKLGNLLIEWAAKQKDTNPGQVIFNPALSPHHSEDLGIVQAALRANEWRQFGKPGDHKGRQFNFKPTRNRHGGF
jgi:hypothetical protein